MSADWLQRPALEWDGDAHGDYWDHEVLQPWVVVEPGRGSDGAVGEAREQERTLEGAVASTVRRSHLSYLSVSILTAAISHGLRKVVASRKRAAAELDGDVVEAEGRGPASLPPSATASVGTPTRTIYIAVAIPEGIMLPLAISAVHVLNWQLNAETASGSGSGFSAVLIPVDPSDAPKRLEHMLNTCQPALILTAANCDNERIGAAWRHATLNVWELIQPLQSCARETMNRTVLALGESLDGTGMAWHEWILKCEAALYGVDVARPIHENRVSHVVFTSGTTGKPKGCVSSIRSLLRYLRAKNDSHGISQRSKVLLASAVSFDPCLGDVLATFTARATLVLPKRCHLLERLLPLLQTFEITHCLCTPTLWSTMLTAAGAGPDAVPCLEVVALGGEEIPPALVQVWGRSGTNLESEGRRVRLLATYGVTEACVYQTVGEVFRGKAGDARRHTVGHPFDGMHARICAEAEKVNLSDAPLSGNGVSVGEVVLHGSQVDEFHCYLRQPNESCAAFVRDETGRVCYRTGDRGYFDPVSSQLFLCGRIDGEDGMIKVNGVRVELGEVEAALQDDTTEYPVVVDCLVKVERRGEAEGVSASLNDLMCFVLLSNACLAQMGVIRDVPDSGVLVPPNLPLFVLLRERCRLKARVVPSTFTIIPRIPLTPTGKRDRKWTRTIEESADFSSLTASDTAYRPVPLRQYSETGALLASILVEHLNLLPAQEALLTTSSRYATAGGDSLSATRVVRALYAHHCGVQDSRFLGGAYGQLEEPFTVRAIVTAASLATYADWLDKNGFRNGASSANRSDSHRRNRAVEEDRKGVDDNDAFLYEALLQAVTLGHDHVAAALLDVGADPNYCSHGGRLGKVSGRKNRMATFRTSPLHIACLRGNRSLVQKLLECKARYNSPDPSGMFPIHLLAAGNALVRGDPNPTTDDLERLACMKLLLRAGTPLLMKDGSKQTVLHCAARSGYCELLRFLMIEFERCVKEDPRKEDPRKADCFNWRDNWSRTPVHWAVLNGNVEALEVLLRMGCCAHPRKPKVIAGSSVANESPSEICERLYGSSELGRRIKGLLDAER